MLLSGKSSNLPFESFWEIFQQILGPCTQCYHWEPINDIKAAFDVFWGLVLLLLSGFHCSLRLLQVDPGRHCGSGCLHSQGSFLFSNANLLEDRYSNMFGEHGFLQHFPSFCFLQHVPSFCFLLHFLRVCLVKLPNHFVLCVSLLQEGANISKVELKLAAPPGIGWCIVMLDNVTDNLLIYHDLWWFMIWLNKYSWDAYCHDLPSSLPIAKVKSCSIDWSKVWQGLAH